MAWVDIEDAVQSAVTAASELDSGQVAWSYQNVDEPTLPHIRISFGGAIAIGIDRVDTSTDLTRAPGQEIKIEIKGVREVPLEIECFTVVTSGDSAARQMAELVRTKLRLPSIRFGLTRAGLGLFDLGPVNYIPDIPSTNFRGRAVCTIRCYVPVQDCIEYVGYIARVAGSVFPQGLHSTGFGASGIAFDTG